MERRQFIQSIMIGATAAHFSATAQTGSWPDKPIKLILSQPAGSGADTMARLISEQLSRKWGQSIVIDNRPGGQNVIGAQLAAKSAGDGYNFYFATAAALATNPHLIKGLPYDPKKDFTAVGLVGKVPFLICVNANSSLKTIQDLVAYAKANPGALNVANEGPKTFSGMMTRLVSAQFGIQLNAVSYVSIGAAVTDTVGGQTEAIVTDMPSAMQMIKTGKLRPLAVTTAKRVAGLEAVPPLADFLPGFDFAGWLAIVAPTGTPAAAIQRFNRDMDAVLLDKEIGARILAIGPITEGALSVQQATAFLNAEYDRWTKVTKEIGILPE